MKTVAELAGIAPADVVAGAHRPVLASVGNPFFIAEVTDEALTRAAPDLGAFRRAVAERPQLEGRLSLHLYARGGERIRARMFAPLAGIVEDPATGSANAPLGALLLSLTGAAEGRYEIAQGVEMGRPSLLRVTARRARRTASAPRWAAAACPCCGARRRSRDLPLAGCAGLSCAARRNDEPCTSHRRTGAHPRPPAPRRCRTRRARTCGGATPPSRGCCRSTCRPTSWRPAAAPRPAGRAGGRRAGPARRRRRPQPAGAARTARGGARTREAIDYHPAYREMERIAFGEFGLAAMSHRAGVLRLAGAAAAGGEVRGHLPVRAGRVRAAAARSA